MARMAAAGAARTPGPVGAALTAAAPIAVAALALARVFGADDPLLQRAGAAVLIGAVAALLVPTWTGAPRRRTLVLGVLLAAVGVLAPTSLAALLVIAAALRIGRDVAGWGGLIAVGCLAGAHAAGLLVHGVDAVAPAAVAGLLGIFAFGLAEPEQGAWCACEWSKKSVVAGLDTWFLARDARRR